MKITSPSRASPRSRASSPYMNRPLVDKNHAFEFFFLYVKSKTRAAENYHYKSQYKRLWTFPCVHVNNKERESYAHLPNNLLLFTLIKALSFYLWEWCKTIRWYLILYLLKKYVISQSKNIAYGLNSIVTLSLEEVPIKEYKQRAWWISLTFFIIFFKDTEAVTERCS